jgi:hypothetical protein
MKIMNSPFSVSVAQLIQVQKHLNQNLKFYHENFYYLMRCFSVSKYNSFVKIILFRGTLVLRECLLLCCIYLE